MNSETESIKDFNGILIKNQIYSAEEKSILSADDLNYYKTEKKEKKSHFFNNFRSNSEETLEKENKNEISKNFEKKKFFDIIEKLFYSEETTKYSEENFSKLEKKFLFIILLLKYPKLKNIVKKIKNGNDTSNISDILEDLIKFIPGMKFNKKNEEVNKFIYKFTIKNLKKDWYNNNPNNNYSHNFDSFYEFYFREICEKYNTKLEDYHDPLNLKEKKSTLNNHFFYQNFLSEKFKYDFQFFLENKFESKYRKVINKKLEKFICKYTNVLMMNIEKVDLENSEFEFKTKRIHFPWTINEVRTAIFKFKNKFLKN
jgi:hypothetical protein